MFSLQDPFRTILSNYGHVNQAESLLKMHIHVSDVKVE